MANFWDLGNNETVTETKEYEAPSGGGDYVFSEGAKVAAVIDEMKWHSFDGGERFINYRLTVIAPEKDADGVGIKNRKLFMKLYPGGNARSNKNDADKMAKKSARDKRLLGAMATNAGGGLLKLTAEPTDDDFASHMLMKPMTFLLGAWEMEIDGQKKRGNYVKGVGSYTGTMEPVGGAAKPVQKAAVQVNKDMPDDSDIPF